MLYTHPLPPQTSAANRPSADAPSRHFAKDLASFEQHTTARWHEQPETLPSLGTPFTRHQQRRAERAADRLLDEIEPALRRLTTTSEAPRGDEHRDRHGEASHELRALLRRFAEEALAMPARELDLIAGDDFFACTDDFAHVARQFDPTLSGPDLFQALRNVWIANVLQRTFAFPVQLSSSIAGYSLLYPVTDNWLDDPTVSGTEKAHFGDRFGERLTGTDLEPSSVLERQAYRLVAMIEQDFPRARYPALYQCLLAIHRGQMRSLTMQPCHGPAAKRRPRSEATVRPPSVTETSVVAASMAKGGASVLTDGYLVTGTLDRTDARFCFGYGAVLQLIDDLQDVEEDRVAGHVTLFSQHLERGPLDGLICKLFRFLDVSLADLPANRGRQQPLLSLMRSQCRRMIIYAAVQHRDHLRPGFLRQLEAFVPLRFTYGRRNRRRFLRRALKMGRLMGNVGFATGGAGRPWARAGGQPKTASRDAIGWRAAKPS